MGVVMDKICRILLVTTLTTLISFLIVSNVYANKTNTKVNSTLKPLSAKKIETNKAKNSKLNSKIDQFLGVIKKARTMDEVRKAFKKQTFSKKEIAQIEKAIKTPLYSNKLNRLSKQSVLALKKVKPLTAKLNKENSQLRRLQKKKISATNQRLQTLMITKRPLTNRPVTINPNLAPVGIPGVGDFSSLPTIELVEPATGRVNEPLTLLGENFGDQQGTVTAIIGNFRINCSVNRWADGYIRINVPAQLQPIVRDGAQSVYFRVRNHENKTGFSLVEVNPDLSQLRPTISTISPGEITPGQQILIAGTNFLSQKGEVVFILSDGRRISGIIENANWTDMHILVLLNAPIGGLLEDPCSIEVINTAGVGSSSATVRFIPSNEIFGIQRTDFLSAQFIFGKKRTRSCFRCPIPRGWKVKNREVTFRGDGPGYGAYWLRRPEIGSNSPSNTIELWVDGFSSVTSTVWLWLEGPIGTFTYPYCDAETYTIPTSSSEYY
jgi:IPT/TIG domain-containing protein